MAAQLAALAASLLGLCLLYVGWRGGVQRVSVRVGMASASGLIALALVLWIMARGVGIGASLWLLAIAPLAWLVIVARAPPPAARADEQGPAPLGRPTFTALSAQLLRTFAVLPLAGATAACAAVVLTAWLPWQPANRLSLAILVMPVLWGLAVYWVCADRAPRRPLVALTLLLTVSASWLWV